MSIASLISIAHGSAMARTKNANIYLRVRRWVDHDLATRRRPVSIFGPFFLAAFAMIGAHIAGSTVEAIGWIMIGSLGAVWTGFVGWRIARLLRAISIKGDRAFDQRDKFFLSPEYHSSESVTATSQRKRKQRQRSPRR